MAVLIFKWRRHGGFALIKHLYRIPCAAFGIFIAIFCMWSSHRSYAGSIPDQPELSCKYITQGSGDTNLFDVDMCVVESGGFISVKGDLIIRVRSRAQLSGSVNFKNCEAQFTPASEFAARKFRSGGFSLIWNFSKNVDYFILAPQLSLADRISWKKFSLNGCDWAFQPEPETPPRPVVKGVTPEIRAVIAPCPSYSRNCR